MRVVWAGKEEWHLFKKWKQFYKPLKKDGLATRLILSFISGDNLSTMMMIYYQLAFMLKEFDIYPYPIDKLNVISEELAEIKFLSREEKAEIINFIVNKIERAIKKQPKISKIYRKVYKLNRDDLAYRHKFPERFLSEMKNKNNFPLYCLLYFFDYSLPDTITSKEIQERIRKIEVDEGIKLDGFDKIPLITKTQENKKWILVSNFIYEQLGIVMDKEELIKALKRYWRYINPVYKYIYHIYPHKHKGFTFLYLPMYSGMRVLNEKGEYTGTILTFFKQPFL